MTDKKEPKAIKPVQTAKKAVVKTVSVISKPAVKKTPLQSSFLEVPVFGQDAKVIKSYQLPQELFDVAVSPRLLSQYVRVYLANQRQGNASTKTRGEVAGTTKKIYRQKGTGRARHGAKKASLFIGGGITFGPLPREIHLDMNQKQRRKALLGALTLKAKEKEVDVLSSSLLTIEPKTKGVVSLFRSMGSDTKSILLIIPKIEKHGLQMASRNIANINIVAPENLNAYQILNHTKLVFVEDAVAKLQELFSKKS